MAIKVKKILVSQPAPQTEKSPYFDIAEKYQLDLDFIPLIRVDGVDIKEFRQQKIAILDHTAVVFTARVAVDHFFAICTEMKIAIPDTMKYFCISEAIALYLQKYIIYRKRKIFFSETGKMEGLSSALDKNSKEKFIVPVSDVHNESMTGVLDGKKINYTKSIMYRTVSNDITAEQIASYDMMIFFSPSGIASLRKNAPDFEQGTVAIAAFGSTTGQAVKDAGFRLDCEAPLPGIPSMTAALEDFIKKNHSTKNKN